MRLLALGDSYTVGEGVDPVESWPFLLRSEWPELIPTVIAQTGWTSGELLAALQEHAPLTGFALATLMIGVNDQYRGLPIAGLVENCSAIIAAGRAATGRGPVLVISIPDWSVTPYGADFDRDSVAAEIDAFNRALSGLAAAHELPFVDVTPLSRASETLVAGDGLHPSPAQHALWAAEIGREMRSALVP